MLDIHVAEFFNPGDEVALYPRTADFFSAEVTPERVAKLKVSADLTVGITADEGDYWIVGNDKTIRVLVPAGHDEIPKAKKAS